MNKNILEARLSTHVNNETRWNPYDAILKELKVYGFGKNSRVESVPDAVEFRKDIRRLVLNLPTRLPRFTRSESEEVVTERISRYEKEGNDFIKYLISFLDVNTLPRMLQSIQRSELDSSVYASVDAQKFHGIDVASCMKHVLSDLPRTKAYMMSVWRSVHSVSKKNTVENKKNQVIHVLDAGCGAFPVLAIAAALSNPNVRVTCIECNPYAVVIAKELVRCMGLSKQVSILFGDATKVDLGNVEYDIICSETIDAAGVGEAAKKIFTHVKSSLKEGGICIPSSFSVCAFLADVNTVVRGTGMTNQSFIHTTTFEQPIINPNPEDVTRRQKIDMLNGGDVISFEIPLTDKAFLKSIYEGDACVVIKTTITLDGGAHVRPQHSHQTRDYIVYIKPPQELDLGPNPTSADLSVKISYRVGDHKVQATVVNNSTPSFDS